MTKTLSPPKPPRVSVPVDAEVLVTFERLAKAGNMSTGRAMAEWLRDTSEAAELMASTFERARAAPKLVTAELHAMMLGMTDQSKELADRFAKFKGAMPEDTSRHPEGAAAGLSVVSKLLSVVAHPPSCNTGGKVPQRGSQVEAKKPSVSLEKVLPAAKKQDVTALSQKRQKKGRK